MLSFRRYWYCTTVSPVGIALAAMAVQLKAIAPGFGPIVAEKLVGAATGVAVRDVCVGRLYPATVSTRSWIV